MDDPRKKRESLVQQFRHDEDAQNKLDRVIVISVDEKSAEYITDWALTNFIDKQRDLVILVHVRNIDLPLAPYINPTGFVEDLDDKKREESHRLLETYAPRFLNQKIAFKAVAMIGEPKVEIIRKVQEIQADVLIMGSRHHGLIQRTLLGSVSDYCVHRCPCSTIIVRPEQEQTEPPRRRSIFSRRESR
ncbi:hypothetical protein EC973_003732 [Apophysomyces ossiformis]|uniref:UspA domain-containing protein n=1 Tax=Apophysomyces ossiformis TaxID=679940 RepID=A0A8H7BL25_9FUNG|nr:hypothetical protein EC973_003732 [Apophysomyces ossiformis]